MCDIRYFKAAYHNYEVAKRLIPFASDDEMFLNDVAYNLQQCVEKVLKAFLECKGVTVPNTHKINKLVDMTKNNGSYAVVTDWVADNVYEIASWEADTRYNFDMKLNLDRINEGLYQIGIFLEENHMSYKLNPAITSDIKNRLHDFMPDDYVVADDFEWNCYYVLFHNRL